MVEAGSLDVVLGLAGHNKPSLRPRYLLAAPLRVPAGRFRCDAALFADTWSATRDAKLLKPIWARKMFPNTAEKVQGKAFQCCMKSLMCGRWCFGCQFYDCHTSCCKGIHHANLIDAVYV
jgi:hypothetical protein